MRTHMQTHADRPLNGKLRPPPLSPLFFLSLHNSIDLLLSLSRLSTSSVVSATYCMFLWWLCCHGDKLTKKLVKVFGFMCMQALSVLFLPCYLLSVVCVLIFLPEAVYICIHVSQYIYNRTFLPPFSETESELVEVGSIYIHSCSCYLHYKLLF